MQYVLSTSNHVAVFVTIHHSDLNSRFHQNEVEWFDMERNAVEPIQRSEVQCHIGSNIDS